MRGYCHPVRMNMILLKPGEVDASGRCVLSDHRAKHIRSVLKAETGKSLRIGLLNGPLGSGLVDQSGSDGIILKCDFDDEPPPEPRIDLLLAMPRPKVMKRLWAQLSALGVGRIVLLRADRVERYYFDSHVLDPEFYTGLLMEGLQQARCTHLPEVLVRPLFKPFVEDELDQMFSGHLKLLADPSGQQGLGALTGSIRITDRVLLAIGPEGGWSPYELNLLADHGFELVGMGKRILRTDTATIGLISMLAEYLLQR